MQATNRKLAQMYQSGYDKPVPSADKIRDLALKFLPIVKGEVSRVKLRLPRHIEADDLQGVAIAGMMRAFEKGDGIDEEKFGVYVRQRIRGAILDELRRMDVFSRSVRRKAREYDRVVQEIEQREGRMASETEIREDLGLSEGEFSRLLEDLKPISFLSFDDPAAGERGQLPISERLEDPDAESVHDRMETREALDLVAERLKTLPKIEQKILHMYYFKDFRLAEIARVFELSESRICQLHTKAIRGLRMELRRHMESTPNQIPQ